MPTPADPAQPLADKTIQELQAMANEAAIGFSSDRRGAPRLSRSAHLHLIDQLSRRGGAGLAIFAGVSIFIAIAPARDLPIRMAVWAAMMFGSLYLCRRFRRDFRSGDRIASHPFRWRANYAATLAVVSAAFGAGAWLLVKNGTDPVRSMEILALMAFAAAAAAAFHASHRASAAAALAPSYLAIVGAAISSFGLSTFTLALGAAGAFAALILAMAVRRAEKEAAARFPRTNIVRSENERRTIPAQARTERKAG